MYGDVELDDDPAPVGTNININLNGDPVATTEVTVAGEYGPVQVWADEARHGDIFSFTVDGNVATSDPAAPEFGWLNQEVDLTAYAGPPPTFYTLDVDIIPVGPPAGGTVTDTGINCPGDCTQDYVEDTIVQLTANPNVADGFVFTFWTGPVDNALANPTTVTMDADKQVIANFRIPGEHVLQPGLNTLSTPGYLASTLGDIIPGAYGIDWIGYRLNGTWSAASSSTTIQPLDGFAIINLTDEDIELDVANWPWAAWPGSQPLGPPKRPLTGDRWALVGPAPGLVNDVAPDTRVREFLAGVEYSRVVSPGWGDQVAWTCVSPCLGRDCIAYKAYFVFPLEDIYLTGTCTVP